MSVFASKPNMCALAYIEIYSIIIILMYACLQYLVYNGIHTDPKDLHKCAYICAGLEEPVHTWYVGQVGDTPSDCAIANKEND